MKKQEDKFQNQLYYGDNLDIMRQYIKDETIDLCYIDPPFNSKRNYNQIYMNVGQEDRAQAQAFIDTWTWSNRSNKEIDELFNNEKGLYTAQTIKLIEGLEKVLGRASMLSYLISMTLRITEIQRVLKKTGSFYLHCDPTMSHYLKIICDSIFCPKGGDFINEITWKRTTTHNDAKQGAKHYGRVHDVLFFYVKNKNEYCYNTPYLMYSKEYMENTYNKVDENGKRFKSSDLSAAKGGGDTSYLWKGFAPPEGRFWAYSQANMQIFEEKGQIYYTSSGKPYLKQYLDEMKGVSVDDIWSDIKPLSSKDAERMGYQTQKPEALLERIIETATNKDDIVLDAYCGCGTTIAVAQKLKRKWIGIDITYHSISLILKRLEDSFNKNVIDNIELTGVPKDFESAVALANKDDDRVRKEFEKWAVLTYSNNRAIINEKKGKDFGIDGTAFISDRIDGDIKQIPIIFSVKSDKHPKPSYVRDLIGVLQREKAAMGYFITLYEPTKDMIDEAHKQGEYKNELFDLEFSKVKIVTIMEILEGKQMRLPKSISTEVLKSAQKKKDKGDQMKLDILD